MRLSTVLRQFASEAPWLQVEIQRTSAELYRCIAEHLRDAEKARTGGELTPEQEEAVLEIARHLTPSFNVPAINAKLQLELAKVTNRGWLLQKRTTSETTDFTIDMSLEAAPLSPLAALPNLLPTTSEALEYESGLEAEEMEECKWLIAGTPAEGGKSGERIELIARYLSSPESNWSGVWQGSEASYDRLVGNVEGAKWGDNYRDGMRAILRRAFLVEGLEQTSDGKRMRDYIIDLKAPNWFFLRHLRVMKYIQDGLLEGHQ